MAKTVFGAAFKVKKLVKKSTSMTNSFNYQYSAHNLVYFKTAQHLYDNIVSHLKTLEEITYYHSLISSVSSLHNVLSMTILAKNNPNLTEDHHSDIRLICSAAKDTVSADVPKKLELMAREIFLSGRKQQFCSVDPDEGVQWLAKNLPEVNVIFQSFIDQNKHRCYKEFDFSSTTWGMRPGLVIEMLQGILKFAETEAALTKTNEVSAMNPGELVDALKTKPQGVTKYILRFMIQRAELAVQCREQTKSNLISAIHEFRLGFRHLGQLLTQEGFLPQPDLVFLLNLGELKQLLATRDVTLVKKAMRRQKIIHELQKDKYPDLIWGKPTPINKKKVVQFESGTEVSEESERRETVDNDL